MDLESELQAVLDKGADGGPGPDLLGRQSVNFRVPLVAEDDVALAVEDDNSERQVVDGVGKHRPGTGRLRTSSGFGGIGHPAILCRDLAALDQESRSLEYGADESDVRDARFFGNFFGLRSPRR